MKQSPQDVLFYEEWEEDYIPEPDSWEWCYIPKDTDVNLLTTRGAGIPLLIFFGQNLIALQLLSIEIFAKEDK